MTGLRAALLAALAAALLLGLQAGRAPDAGDLVAARTALADANDGVRRVVRAGRAVTLAGATAPTATAPTRAGLAAALLVRPLSSLSSSSASSPPVGRRPGVASTAGTPRGRLAVLGIGATVAGAAIALGATAPATAAATAPLAWTITAVGRALARAVAGAGRLPASGRSRLDASRSAWPAPPSGARRPAPPPCGCGSGSVLRPARGPGRARARRPAYWRRLLRLAADGQPAGRRTSWRSSWRWSCGSTPSWRSSWPACASPSVEGGASEPVEASASAVLLGGLLGRGLPGRLLGRLRRPAGASGAASALTFLAVRLRGALGGRGRAALGVGRWTCCRWWGCSRRASGYSRRPRPPVTPNPAPRMRLCRLARSARTEVV